MNKVSSDFVNQLLETRGWDKAGIRVDERKKVGSDKAPESTEGEVVGKSAYDNPNNDPKGITEHVCPLCESNLGDKELTDEVLEEHAAAMLEVFSEAGLISEEAEVGKDFIIENANEILDILSEAGLIVETAEEEEEEEE
jgi:hypothetical protein